MKKSEYLTPEEYSVLTPKQKELYDYAMEHMEDDWAMGSYGGWARAHEALKRLGWIEHSNSIGHRNYIALTKPITFSADESLSMTDLF
jgi:hypothetical protein